MRSAPTGVVITGVGVLSPAGRGMHALAERLYRGECLGRELPPVYSARGEPQAGASVTQVPLEGLVSPERLRRIGRLSRMALVAAHDALAEGAALPSDAAGVVIGTGLGALEETAELLRQLGDGGPSVASPSLFPASVMNVVAAQLSMELGLQGYQTTVNHREVSGELALLVARDALRLGHAPALLVGAVDELTPAAHHAYRRFGALADGPPRPYAVDRGGQLLGEGAVTLRLEPEELARGAGRASLGRVVGCGSASGDRSFRGWEAPRGSGASVAAGVEAIRAALEEAGRGPEEVDLVIGCGCGSRGLDALDASVLREAFGARPVPVTTPHGVVGTYMGAGLLRVAAALVALARGEVFAAAGVGPCGGLPDLPGLVTSMSAASLKRVLVVGHACGGTSAAILIERGA
ncbi:MAG: beta-ketoacyl synthase chain length factor [Deltaproteobacteria bacterium]|nr:beta-ketoacyl synthase chain length factor [Deltaproteobacteria bacterium]